MDKDFKRNSSGYYDPTAWDAVKNINAENRIKKLLDVIHSIASIAGFEIQGRITFMDTKTGKVYK